MNKKKTANFLRKFDPNCHTKSGRSSSGSSMSKVSSRAILYETPLRSHGTCLCSLSIQRCYVLWKCHISENPCNIPATMGMAFHLGPMAPPIRQETPTPRCPGSRHPTRSRWPPKSWKVVSCKVVPQFVSVQLVGL